MKITAAQIRRACALLYWGSSQIVRQAGVSYEAARCVREDENIVTVSSSDLLAICTALKRAGVGFAKGGTVILR